jgi:hypothetical protein
MKDRSRLLLIIIFAVAFLLTGSFYAAEGSNANIGQQSQEQVFNDAVRSFQLFSALIGQVNYDGGYIIPGRALSEWEARQYLQAGFSDELAMALVDYYLQYSEELQGLIPIPTDSIPIITAGDRDQTGVELVNSREAVLTRVYTDCYTIGDVYIYSIRMAKVGDRWKVYGLWLERRDLNHL